MEVAGVVLGAIPIAIAALECYVASDSLFSNVFSRQTHVRSLARSLRGYRMEYRTSLELLLRRIGVYDPTEHTHEDISALLQDPLTSTRLKDYLGDEKFDVYQDAIMEAQEAIYKVVKNIKGLVPKEAKSEVSMSFFVRSTSLDATHQVEYDISMWVACMQHVLDETHRQCILYVHVTMRTSTGEEEADSHRKS
jgi:hypothetical protein